MAGLVMEAPTESRRVFVLFCFVFILRNPRLARVFFKGFFGIHSDIE